MENTQKLTLTLNETCELTGLSRPMVTAYIKRRNNPLPCIVTNSGGNRSGGRGGRYRIPRAALERWLLEEAERNSKDATTALKG